MARQRGIGSEPLRNWVRQAQVDGGHRPGVTSDEAERIAELEREVRELRRVLQVAPSSYYAAKRRPPSARAVRDEQFKAAIVAVFEGNYRCYGARKIWRQLRREGHRVARCTVERLMPQLGLTGLVRGKAKRITIADVEAARPADLNGTSGHRRRTGCGSPTSNADVGI